MPGVTPSLVIDRDSEKIRSLFNDVGISDVVISSNAKVIAEAIEAGKPAGATTTEFISELPFDIAVEATGVPEVGANGHVLLFACEERRCCSQC